MASRTDVGNSIDKRRVIEIAQGEEDDFKPGRHQNHHAYTLSKLKGNNYLRWSESLQGEVDYSKGVFSVSSTAINENYDIQNGEWESAYSYDSSGIFIDEDSKKSYYNGNNIVIGEWIQMNNYHLAGKDDSGLIGFAMQINCSCRRRPNNVVLLGSLNNDIGSENSSAVVIRNVQLEYRDSVAIIDMSYNENILFNYYRLVVTNISNPEVLSAGAPATISKISFFSFIKSSTY